MQQYMLTFKFGCLLFFCCMAKKMSHYFIGMLHEFNVCQQRLRQCLGVQDQATPVVQKCLCRDQVEDLTAPDGTQNAKSESLSKWWRKLLSAANSQTKLTFELYEDLVAR